MLLLLQASDDTCTKMPSQAESLRQEMHEHINWYLCCHLSFFPHRLSLSLIISQFSQIEIPSEEDKMYIAYTQITHCVIAVWFNIYKVNRAVAHSQICIPSFSIQLARITSSLIILEIT